MNGLRAHRLQIVLGLVIFIASGLGGTAFSLASDAAVFELNPLSNAWLKVSPIDAADIKVSNPSGGQCDKELWPTPFVNHLKYTGKPPSIVKTAVPNTPNITVLEPGRAFQVNCFEPATWIVTITATNSHDVPITNVTVSDNFGGEFAVAMQSVTQGTPILETSGATEKVQLTWSIGTLPVGGSARLDLIVSTDHNPAGKQEFTSPGLHEMNSGAVLKYDLRGVQQSDTSGKLVVTSVLGADATRSSLQEETQAFAQVALMAPSFAPSLLSTQASTLQGAAVEGVAARPVNVEQTFVPQLDIVKVVEAHGKFPKGYKVPRGLRVGWQFTLRVVNTTGVRMTDVRLLENLGAQLDVDRDSIVVSPAPRMGRPPLPGRGREIDWWIPDLDPGAVAELKMSVHTRMDRETRDHSPNWLPGESGKLAYTTDGGKCKQQHYAGLTLTPVWVDSADTLEVTVGATRLDWQIRKAGTYMAEPLQFQILSSRVVEASFSGFDDVRSLGPEAGYSIPTFYQFSETMPGNSDWIRAANLNNQLKRTASDQAGQWVTWKLWPRLDVLGNTRAADYEDVATVTFAVREVSAAVLSESGAEEYSKAFLSEEVRLLEVPQLWL